MPTDLTTIADGLLVNSTATGSLHGVLAGGGGGNQTNNSLPDMAESLDTTNPRLVNGVVVLILMVLNLLGNSLVLYVYHSLFENTVFCLFVKALASLDLLTALTTMPMDIVMKMRSNDEDVVNMSAICKMSHYQVYANSLLSGCVLTLIAYQRYRKICHPLQRGMLGRKAKILLVIMGVVCVIIGLPTVFLYGPRHIKVLVRNTEVKATICRADENFQDSPLYLIFSYFLTAAFGVVLGSTCVLYFMVFRAIKKFEKRNSQLFCPSPTTPTPEMDTINEEYGNGHHQPVTPLTGRTLVTSPVHGRPVKDPFQTRRQQPASPNNLVQTRGGGGAQLSKKRERFSQARQSTFSAASGTNLISAQMHRVFSIITVVYIISYLPHLVALILTKTLKLDDEVLTYTQRMALEFAYNCPYISTVSNPLIYGFSSSEFRDRVRDLLESCDCCGCCCCCCCDYECGDFLDCCDNCCSDDEGGRRKYSY